MRLLRFPLVLLLATLCVGCGEEPAYQEQGYVFGTLVDVSIYGVPETQAKPAVAAVMREFQRLHNQLHAWQPSELSELNTAIAQGQSKVVSPELAAMLQDAAQLSQQSKGTFNPAIGGLIQAWGFHADEFKPIQPDVQMLTRLVQSNPQMSDLVFNPSPLPSIMTADVVPNSDKAGVTVTSKNKTVQLDLGGYAKGYALDRALLLLKQHGIRNALVNIGGNIIALGQHGSRPWRVGIQHPRRPGALATLALNDGEAIGTSGDYQRYFEWGGKRYCHLIDPHTGQPMQGVRAVTVLTSGARAGILSDVDSKPLFLAGERGWREAAQQMDVPLALLIDAQGGLHLTAALQKRLEFSDKNLFVEVLP